MKQKTKGVRWIGEWAPNLGHDPDNPFPLKPTPSKPKRERKFLHFRIRNALFNLYLDYLKNTHDQKQK